MKTFNCKPRHLTVVKNNSGTAPSVADFALYGQLSQLVVDSSPDRSYKKQFKKN